MAEGLLGNFTHELKLIFSDSGVMVIFFLAGLAYPILYNLMYLNGVLSETPIAVVDYANCSDSRRFIREVDATRECTVKYRCVNTDEAQTLMKDGKSGAISTSLQISERSLPEWRQRHCQHTRT